MQCNNIGKGYIVLKLFGNFQAILMFLFLFDIDYSNKC